LAVASSSTPRKSLSIVRPGLSLIREMSATNRRARRYTRRRSRESSPTQGSAQHRCVGVLFTAVALALPGWVEASRLFRRASTRSSVSGWRLDRSRVHIHGRSSAEGSVNGGSRIVAGAVFGLRVARLAGQLFPGHADAECRAVSPRRLFGWRRGSSRRRCLRRAPRASTSQRQLRSE